MPSARLLILAAATALACATAASAADPAPTVVLLTPATGASVTVDGKHNPTFSWQITYPQAPTTTTEIRLSVSADPNFQSSVYNEARLCDVTNPACFTSTTPQGTYWISAATGSASLPTRPVTLYWRITITPTGQPPFTTGANTFLGVPATGPNLRPRVSVKGTTVRRGSRAKVRFHLADDGGIVLANARLLYHGRTLLSTMHTFSDVDWANVYVFWFDVPRYAPRGRYTACVRATDPQRNSAQSCASVTIR